MAPPDPSHPAPAWSFTRDQTLKACPRRYYFQYYLASAGASRAAPPLARRVFALNRLTSLDQILGIAIHDCARLLCKAIRRRKPHPGEKDLAQLVRKALNSAYRASRDANQRASTAATAPRLREFYYGGGVSGQTINRIRSKAARCLSQLLALPLWETLRICAPAEILIIDRPQRFTCRDHLAIAAPDLVFRQQGGHWVVVDWKTGRTRAAQEKLQVSVYGLLLTTTNPQAAVGSLKGCILHLYEGSSEEHLLTAGDLAMAADHIAHGAATLHEAEATVKRLGDAAAQAFPLTSCRTQCSYCNFFEVCEAELRE